MKNEKYPEHKYFLLAGALSALSLESLLGCDYDEFPQYSGEYTLQEVSYSDPSFIGEKQMPSELKLVDRMEYVGNYWKHYIHFEFIPDSQDQAAGTFTEELDRLALIDKGVWPNEWYDGAEIHHEPKVYGSSAWCNYQYLYFLYFKSVPSAEILQNTYPGYKTYLGKDPVSGMDLYESLSHPEDVEFDEGEWHDAVSENEGLTLYFTFTRHLKSESPGWEGGYKDCILPPDAKNRKEESLQFTYHASVENLDNQTDIRKKDVLDIKDNQLPESFFRKVVPDIK